MHFNDVNFALGLTFAAFNGAGSAPSGYAPEVFHSRVFSAPGETYFLWHRISVHIQQFNANLI